MREARRHACNKRGSWQRKGLESLAKGRKSCRCLVSLGRTGSQGLRGWAHRFQGWVNYLFFSPHSPFFKFYILTLFGHYASFQCCGRSVWRTVNIWFGSSVLGYLPAWTWKVLALPGTGLRLHWKSQSKKRLAQGGGGAAQACSGLQPAAAALPPVTVGPTL